MPRGHQDHVPPPPQDPEAMQIHIIHFTVANNIVTSVHTREGYGTVVFVCLFTKLAACYIPGLAIR